MKFQSSLEIAGSLRNSFRASVEVKIAGGRALNVLGALWVTEDYQTPNARTSYSAVRLWVIRSMVKRVTAQTVS